MMRPISIKLMSAIWLMVTLFIFVGCGSSDLLDEETTRYHATASPRDGDNQTTEIDVFQTLDCDGDLTTVDPEDFFAFDVDVEIDADNDTGAEFNVESYTVNFRRNHGANGGASVLPVDMPDLIGTLNPINAPIAVQVSAGGSASVDLLVWTQGDKGVYRSTVEALPGVTNVLSTDFWYDIQVVLNCRTLDDETFKITTPWTPVHFAGFDNC